MPCRPRLMLANVPLHIISRGNNRHACFFADDDYHLYLEWLQNDAVATGCRIHAYVLMTNHVHLLLSCSVCDGVGALMKALGQRYTQYINRTYRRTGTLWEGRYHSCLTQQESYFLACQRYIELNPVRASMVAHPAQYRWSSYRVNTQGEPSELVSPHASYLALGDDAKARQIAYRELFRHQLAPGLVDAIRQATNGNYALGDTRFGEQIAQALGRRTQPGKAGRPRKVTGPENNDLFEK
jgi:putative transposase